MKKIILSLSIVVAVAAIVVGATTAYFSDTEESVGNTFTAGALDLKVDSECHYNGMTCSEEGYWTDAAGNIYEELGPCDCNWLEKDLDGDIFFNFTDVKPGDEGENTISLTVYDNDAWLCAYVENLVNRDNGCNDPESEVDGTCGDPGVGEGELQDNIHLKIWYDVSDLEEATPCDNIWQEEELVLVDGATINGNNGVWPLGQLPGGEKTCLGVGWSVPNAVGNIIQTDSVTGDISFYVEQVRNNPNFVCPAPGQPDPVCGNGIVEGDEECESDADCGAGAFCSFGPTPCYCVVSQPAPDF